MPVLDQKGPKSLNYINKRTDYQRIEYENHYLKSKILRANSNYSMGDPKMRQFVNLTKMHKKLLEEDHPSVSRVDPLIEQAIKNDRDYNANKSLAARSKFDSQSQLSHIKEVSRMKMEQFNIDEVTSYADSNIDGPIGYKAR